MLFKFRTQMEAWCGKAIMAAYYVAEQLLDDLESKTEEKTGPLDSRCNVGSSSKTWQNRKKEEKGQNSGKITNCFSLSNGLFPVIGDDSSVVQRKARNEFAGPEQSV